MFIFSSIFTSFRLFLSCYMCFILLHCLSCYDFYIVLILLRLLYGFYLVTLHLFITSFTLRFCLVTSFTSFFILSHVFVLPHLDVVFVLLCWPCMICADGHI